MNIRKNSTPPAIAKWLLERMSHYESDYGITGDLEEEYHRISQKKGSVKAAAWYRYQVVRSLLPYIKFRLKGSWTMFKSYFKIGIRNILKSKGYSFINITGLAIGIACCILILLWVSDELSYDGFHHNGDEIYRVLGHSQSVSGGLHLALTPPPLAETLKAEFAEITDATRLRLSNDWLVTYGKKRFMENGFAFVDPSFFSMFTFPFIHGNASTALQEPNSIVITQRIAEKYFGEENPVGKTINADNTQDFIITGVIKNVPGNSHINFDFAARFSILVNLWEIRLDHWSDNSYYTYIQTREGISHKELSKKIKNVQRDRNEHSRQTLSLQPLKEIHLHSSFLNYSFIPLGDIKYVTIFSLLAILVLIIACINFISLTTAKSANRVREIAVRKVTGAQRKDLIKQFFGESALFTLFALPVALLIVVSVLPVFNNLSGKNISLDMLQNLKFYLGIGLIALITGILSGTYPALYLSAFQPVKVLKGGVNKSGGEKKFRKILVVTQFAISIFLIISTIVIYLQIDYVRHRKLGFDKEYVLYIPIRGEIKEKYETFKNELLNHPGILGISRCSDLPVFPGHLWGDLHWPGKDPKTRPEMNFFSVDYDFIDTFGIEMAAGRKFSKEFAGDKSNYIINEAAAKFTGMTDPVGKWFARGKNRGTIIGVMKDFHFSTMRKKISPLVMQISPYSYFIFVKVSSTGIPGTITQIENTWKKFNPLFPTEYHFLDEAFAGIYRSEQRLSRLFQYFTLLAIFISCLGLLGLASFMARERTKEIGIRKVLGASVSRILLLLSKEFVVLVIIANMIAWPTAFFIVGQWLRNWAYHTELNLFVFVLAAVISLFFSLISVCFQSLKAALTNPVDSLKYD